jgi:hypothetical protein
MMLGVTDHASSLSGHHHFRFCGAGDQEMSTKLTIKGEDFVWKNIEQLRFIYIVCSRKKTRKKNMEKKTIYFFFQETKTWKKNDIIDWDVLGETDAPRKGEMSSSTRIHNV